jgi:hypothetical protein
MHKKLSDKIKKIKKDDPFLVTVTVFSKEMAQGKELETFVFRNKFPVEEMEGTKEAIARLIDELR